MEITGQFWMILGIALAVLVFITFLAAMTRYKRCPSDHILVIYGKVAAGKAARCIHGGAAFVWPLIQDYRYLELTPMTIDIALKNALSKQNIRVNVPSRFTIGISTEPHIMSAAAERLLSMERREIEDNAKDIIFGQLRATIATMDIEEINTDREAFEKKVMDNVESELKKLGLKLINVNITDITDESSYIEALGKKAAAEAINKAMVQVAEQERNGETGKANADKEKRVNVAGANAIAIEGENTAKIKVANSDASRREAEAEAKRVGDAAEKVKRAQADEEGFKAQEQAETTRATREKATQTADILVPAEIAKEKVVIQANAEKEKAKLGGEGRGEAVKAEMGGKAAGLYAILERKAAGFDKIVTASGGEPNNAGMLLVVEQLPAIAKLQAEAISNINFDKIVVMDSGTNGNTTANWLSNITKALPGLHEFANMAGVQLPSALGEAMEKNAPKTKKPTPPKEPNNPKQQPPMQT